MMARCLIRGSHGRRVPVLPFGGAHVCADCGRRVWGDYAPVFRSRSRAAHNRLLRRVSRG